VSIHQKLDRRVEIFAPGRPGLASPNAGQSRRCAGFGLADSRDRSTAPALIRQSRYVRLSIDAEGWLYSTAPKKRFRASAVCWGASSGKKCPAFRARPRTSSPHSRQSPMGPPSPAYQVSSGPWALHRTRRGHTIRRPLARSALSCSRSMVAAARYSSQMACALTLGLGGVPVIIFARDVVETAVSSDPSCAQDALGGPIHGPPALERPGSRHRRPF
jgi:hypothetical protein